MRIQKTIISLMLSFMMCFFILGFESYAAALNKSTVNDTNSVSIEPRAILTYSSTVSVKNNSIKLTANYSINDATDDIVGVQKVYVSYFDPIKYTDVQVNSYKHTKDTITIIYSYQTTKAQEWYVYTTTFTPNK